LPLACLLLQIRQTRRGECKRASPLKGPVRVCHSTYYHIIGMINIAHRNLWPRADAELLTSFHQKRQTRQAAPLYTRIVLVRAGYWVLATGYCPTRPASTPATPAAQSPSASQTRLRPGMPRTPLPPHSSCAVLWRERPPAGHWSDRVCSVVERRGFC